MPWTRVKDKRTGHHYSTAVVDPKNHEVLKQPAVDVHGNPLPAKHNTNRKAAAPAEAAEPDTKGK